MTGLPVKIVSCSPLQRLTFESHPFRSENTSGCSQLSYASPPTSQDNDTGIEDASYKSVSQFRQPPVSSTEFPVLLATSIGSPVPRAATSSFAMFTRLPNRQFLVAHFANVLSPLITFTGESTNPFQRYVLPMSARSTALSFAILTFSCAHLEACGVQNTEKSLDFYTHALAEIQRCINEGTTDDQIVTAIVILVYYEILVHRGNSGIITSHLRGALSILQLNTSDSGAIRGFLRRALSFLDVIVALSYGIAPCQKTSDIGFLFPSSDIDSSVPAVDTLLGMTTELWPVMHDLSRLTKMQDELHAVELSGFRLAGLALRAKMKLMAEKAESALRDWRPLKRNGMTTSSLDFCIGKGEKIEHWRQSIICNAEAYRQAAFVHIHRSVRSLGRHSSTVQYHTKATLAACLRVIMYEGPVSALLWPVFTGACEAVKEVDRNIARTIFREASNRQGFLNIKDSWEIVEEVWRRSDAEAKAVSWKEICKDRGIEIAFA